MLLSDNTIQTKFYAYGQNATFGILIVLHDKITVQEQQFVM